MFRVILCGLGILFSIAVKAQTIDENIEKGVRLYNQMRDYEGSLNTASVKDSNISRLKEYMTQATPFLAGALTAGTAAQQKTARYFTANLQYELGFVYGMRGENYKAYDVLKKIENDYKFFADSTQFPLYYKYDGKNYNIKFSNFAPTLAEYYTGMGEICTNIKKYSEAVNFMQLTMSFPYTTAWYLYIAANKLWENARYQNLRGAPYIDLTLSGLKYCSRLDTAYQRLIRENYYTNCRQFADTLDKLVQNPFYLYKADAYAKAAAYLDSAKETAYAISFYRKAIAKGLNDRAFLRQVTAFAARTNDVAFQQEIAAELKKTYAYEKDEVISNLGTILTQVVASANDPSKHFSEMRGRKMTSRRHGGKIYHTNVELPGAVESFVTDFLGNNVANYYYWKSFIDEEEPAQLKGRLKQRYKALCEELKSLYPNVPVKYAFDNENYFQLKLNSSTTIELNYYYNEGYKDVILLTVISSYSK